MNRHQRVQTISNAKEVINRLAIVLRISQTYSVDNEAVVRAIDAFVEFVTPILASEKALSIELVGEYFYLNEARVRYSVQYYLNFDFLMGEFRKRVVGGISFSEGISRRELQDFIRAFIACLSSDSPYVTLKGSVDTIENMDVKPLKQAAGDNLLDKRRLVKKTYFKAVAHLRTVVSRVTKGEKVEMKKARLVVNSLIDMMIQEEQMLLSMTAIKDYDEYTYYHSVNVSILSIGTGLRLGLNKKRLSELGIAAFLHDIGKVGIPAEILNKVTPFTDEDWEIVRMHPSEGLKKILSSMTMDLLTIRSAIVAFEHHLNFDGSGYPAIPHPRQLDFFSNIVTIADRFDAMTSARVYARVPKSPEEALRQLVMNIGRDVDPVLLKVFIKLTGLYPIGTLVVLDTRELGIVYRGNPELPDRPIIVLIVNTKGEKIESKLVDLADRGLDGRYRRSIRKTLDCNKYDINLSEYLLESYQ